MILSKLILLFFTFSINRLGAFTTASLAISDSAEVRMENLLIEFMSDLKKVSFEKLDHHRLIVLGKRENFLHATKVLLESGTPYFIGTKAEAIVHPLQFGVESVVLFFIDGFSDSAMNSTFAKLPNNYRCKVLIISVEEKKTYGSVATILVLAVKMKQKNVSFARFDGHVIKFYHRISNANCRREITLTNTWIPKKGFAKNANVFRDSLIPNKYGCPMVVSTMALTPTMRLREDENKSLHITGGIEGRLLNSIANYLDVIPVVKLPSVEEQFWISPDGTVSGIVGDVAEELAVFGIGQIRPTPERAELVDLTSSYNHECIVWTVPLRSKYNYRVVFSEFSPATWIMVILSVSLCGGLVYIIPKLNIGYRPTLNIFDVIAMTLNYAIPRHPSGVLYKLFFLVYLHYSRVISTAYSTSLSSILTTVKLEPVVVNEEEILAAGLRTAGSRSSREMLVEQTMSNGTRAELISRFEIITSAEAALARIVDRKDIAYLRHRSTTIHAANELSAAGKPVKFYPLSRCVISYNSVMVTPKGSRLTDKVNNIVMRLAEAGIYNYWLRLDRTSEFRFTLPGYERDTLFRLQSIFALYLCCLIPALAAFGAELIAFKLQLNWFTR